MRTLRLLPIIVLCVACSSNKATPDAHIILSDTSTVVDAPGLNLVDSYMDRDTYQFTTGATTNQLSLRLNWPGSANDLDMYLFAVNKPGDFASGTTTSMMEDEFTTFAVKPNTPYWLWIGQYPPTAGAPTAVTYDASICGETYTAPTSLTCGANSATTYTEANDAMNDYLVASYIPEPTNITGTAFSVCGNINSGHYIQASARVDIDSYRFLTNATANTDVMVTFSAPGADILDAVSFFVWDNKAMVSIGSGRFIGTHGVALVTIPSGAGDYELDVSVHSSGALTTSIPYKITLALDTPATRCMKATTTTNYTEAHDGTDNKGNDMIQIDLATMDPTMYQILTPATTDMAEPTGLTIATGTKYRITGTSAAP